MCIPYHLRATYAFVERNFNLVKRYWGWEIVWLTYSIANTLAITYIGAGVEKISGKPFQADYLILYLLTGALVWHYLALVFDNVSEMIAWERWEGTIEYTLMAPVHRFVHMVGTCLFSLLYGVLHTGIILGIVSIFFHIDLSKANLLGGGLVLLAGSISFIGLGIIGAVLPLLFPERGAQMTHVIQAVFLLISGIYYPVEVLPKWLQMAAKFSPATYVLCGMRRAFLEGASTAELLGIVILLGTMGVVFLPLGVWIFSIAEGYAKKAGKLKRSG